MSFRKLFQALSKEMEEDREWLGVLRRREAEVGRVSGRGGEWKRKRLIKAGLDF